MKTDDAGVAYSIKYNIVPLEVSGRTRLRWSCVFEKPLSLKSHQENERLPSAGHNRSVGCSFASPRSCLAWLASWFAFSNEHEVRFTFNKA